MIKVGLEKIENYFLESDYFQLDSSDEQAAAIRRELDARREKTAEMERVSGERRLRGY